MITTPGYWQTTGRVLAVILAALVWYALVTIAVLALTGGFT